VLADEFLKVYPGDNLAARVRVLQGFSHFQMEEYREAIMSFQNVVDKHVNTDVAERALFLSTLAYSRIDQLDRVITNYNFLASKLLPTPSPWRAGTYYYLGEAYFDQGLYREAAGMYRLVLTGYPRSNVAAASLQGLVASLSRNGQYELALEEQDKFLLALANADSDKGTNSLAVGSIYFNQHNYENALKQFNDFLANNPDDPAAATALVNQGDCYYRLQYYEQAIESWMTLLKRFPEAPEVEEAMYRIADTRFGLGRFDSAAAAYEQLRNRFPEGSYVADASFGLANCLYNQGNDEGAIMAFNAFIQTYPDDPRVEDAELGVQSCYYRSGKDMEEYLATNPESPMAADIYWNKGQDAFAAGNFAEAARAFERVTLDYPESESGPGALFYLAESYYRAEDLNQALAGYHNFMTTHPDHDLAELAHLRAATVLFKQERYVEAAQGYETLVDLFPAGEYAPLSTYNAAVCYQEIEDWHAAIGGYVRFIVDHPDHENAQGLWIQVANLYQEELGDYRQAVEAYEHALESGDAPVAEMRYRQGECFEKDGKMEAALGAYEASAGTSPAADAFRIASLARLAEIAEERGDNRTAVGHWQTIISAGGKPEWTQMAQERISLLQSVGMAGG
jgi:TolA-binding protein